MYGPTLSPVLKRENATRFIIKHIDKVPTPTID